MGFTIILAASIVLSFFLGLFVIYKNSKSQVNISFGILAICVSLWILTNLLADTSKSEYWAMFWSNTAVIPAAIFISLLLHFSFIFPDNQVHFKTIHYLLLYLPAAAIIALSPTKFNIESVVIHDWGVEYVPGHLYTFLIVFVLIFAGGSIFNFVKNYRAAFGLKKQQFRYLLFGSIGMILIGLFTQVIFPILGYSRLAALGPLTALIFIVSVSYSIVAHRLLDIQVIIRRSLIYSILLTSLIGFYSLLVFGFNRLFLPGETKSFPRLTDLIAIVVVAFSVDPLKRFIEKVTDKVFFKATYNFEDKLNQISENLVSVINLSELVQDIKKTVSETVKVSKISIYIKDNNHYNPIPSANDFPSDLTQTLDKKLMVGEYLREYLEIIVIEDIKQSLAEGKIISPTLVSIVDFFAKNGVQVVVPLLVKNELRGLILLGEKKAQDSYSVNDVKFLEILSHQAALALENAKLYEEQRLYNIHLKEEVQKATAELRIANEKLQELDKLKDEFISVTSHDLRTPLTAIKSYLWLAMHGKAGQINDKMKFYLDRSYQSSERMLALIADLLDVSRIERGKIELHLEPADLGKVMEMILDELRSKAMEKRIALKLALPKKPLPEVMLDQERFPEILTNLVGNSLKFTPDKGKVTVTAREVSGKIEISVIDSGVGIHPEDMPKLFSKFGRLDSSYQAVATTGGTGLGLYITKNLVELHGGKISVLSKVGQGTTFTFTLKIATETEKKQRRYVPAPQGVIINPELMKSK